jgi:phosphate starvation-inducible PhoH-like protein
MNFMQLKGFMTRIGKYSKVVLCGDIAQVSPKFRNSGLAEYINMLKLYDARVHILEFTRDDVLRGDICKQQIVMFEDWEQERYGSN